MVISADTRTNLSSNAANMSMSTTATSQHNRSMFMSPTSVGSLGSPTAAMPSEIELHWEPETIRSELQTATIVLSQRCLKLAAKWASEQLLGLPWGQKMESGTSSVAQSELVTAVLQESDPTVLYAKSLMELGEYMHAASVLSRPNSMVTTMAAPLPQLSAYGIFLRAYALFLAGERRKEEDYIELQRYVLIVLPDTFWGIRIPL
jgi:Anaphase promoting complex subunit 8 / Cdc23